MKPIKLVMTAFGPYKNREVIDFRELKDHHLFVISGNTGAGKTTIFDGICFALYGSASGSDRDDNQMLRSDFAEDDVHTSVELIFSLRGRTYRILRQLGHVKKGNKTKTGDKYEFFEIRGDQEIPCVDRQNVSEINKKVEELIGLTQEQFKQIVMLPQGEFRKLLTSKTENKEAILRRLFKTENYKQLNELLKQRRDRIQKAFDQKSQEMELYIHRIPESLPLRDDSELKQVLEAEHHQFHQVVTALEAERKFYEQQEMIHKQQYQAAYEKHHQKSSDYHQAKSMNEQFEEWDEKVRQLRLVNEQLPNIKEKEEQLDLAERALRMEGYDRQAAYWKKEEHRLIDAVKEADRNVQAAEKELEAAQQVYNEQAAKKEEREEIARELDRLTEYVPAVTDLENLKQRLASLQKQVKQSDEKRKTVKTELQKKQEVFEQANKQIQKTEEEVSTYFEKKNQLQDMLDLAILLQKYIELKDKQNKLEQTLQEKRTAYVQIKKIYEEKENIWLSNQAAVLAGHLHEGEACPVCGSLDHPNKADTKEASISKEELENVKQQLEEKQTVFQRAELEAETNRKQMIEKEEEIANKNISMEDVKRQYDTLVNEGKQVRKEVNRLEALQAELKKMKEANQHLSQQIKELETEKDQLESHFYQLYTDYESEKAKYHERLKKIPEHLQDLSVLQKQLEQLKQTKAKLEQAWEEAQQTLQNKKDHYAKMTASAESKQNQLQEIKEKRKQAYEEFQTAMLKEGFSSEQAYRDAIRSEDQRKVWKEEITQFYQKRDMLKQRTEELEKALKDKERIDLSAMEKELDELKQKYEQELTKWNLSQKRLESAIDLRKKISNAGEEAVRLEKKLAAVTDLYDVMRGQNSQKISFERYLQIEYLEQIIHAANQRLIKLSNGQFRLERSDRQEAHGRQSGLGLDIYDAYTGQTRDVKSLSGGEKFNASLSLALGMSDVIQSFQGNISIETMFIDEGFGSLDEESLTKAVDTLVELQESGRMIGVISHVQELKNMLPARLEVVKQKEGYSKTKFVVH